MATIRHFRPHKVRFETPSGSRSRCAVRQFKIRCQPLRSAVRPLMFAIKCLGFGRRRNLRRDVPQKEQDERPGRRRYHAAGFARSCLRSAPARWATRGVCIGVQGGGGVRRAARFASGTNEKKILLSPTTQTDGRTDVSPLRDHREARSSRSSCVRTGRGETEETRREILWLPGVCRLASLEKLTASLRVTLRLQVLESRCC